MIDIFISRPTWISEEFEEGLNGFLSFLDTMDLKPRTLGATDYPTESPLDEVISIMEECQGVIILGYPQIIVQTGLLKDSQIDNLLLPTEWNNIEASLAYAKDKPLLVIHHKGISRGIFDHGAINKFIYRKDLSKANWFLDDNIKGALRKWYASVSSPKKSKALQTTTKPVSDEERLTDECERVLIYIYKLPDILESDGVTHNNVSTDLNLDREMSKFYLDTLSHKELVNSTYYLNESKYHYRLSSKGREYVIKHGLHIQ